MNSVKTLVHWDPLQYSIGVSLSKISNSPSFVDSPDLSLFVKCVLK